MEDRKPAKPEILTYLIVAFLLLGYGWFFSASYVDESGISQQPAVAEHMVKARTILDEILPKAGLSEEVELVVFDPGYFYDGIVAYVDKEGGVLTIHLNTFKLGQFSDDGLKGVLAHEVGHIISPMKVQECNLKDKSTRFVYLSEIEADLEAVKLVGPDVFKVTMRETGYSQAQADLYIEKLTNHASLMK